MSNSDDILVESNISPIQRVRTGLYSLDCALSSRGDIGLPRGCLSLLYGNTHVGKSSLTYYLAASCSVGGRLVLCDLEGIDIEYVKSAVKQAGFTGTLRQVSPVDDKGRIQNHRTMTQDMVADFDAHPDLPMAGILDSVSAYIPAAEMENEIGEANMGRWAFELSQFARKAVVRCSDPNRKQSANMFVVSHSHALLGMGKGHDTSGGEAIKSLSAIRLFLWQKEILDSTEKILGFLVAGKVEKLRYGGKGREFQFVIIPDVGVSKPMTAVFDCFNLGLVKRERTIKIDGKSFGYLSTLFGMALHPGNQFDPFYKLLEEHYGNTNTGLLESSDLDE